METEDEETDMRTRTKVMLAGGAVAVAAVTGTGIAASGSGHDNEAPIPADAIDDASAAALEHTGGGRVTDTEVGDEESLYEVEVTLEDGSQVDVQLDRDFNVVGDEADEDSAEGADDD